MAQGTFDLTAALLNTSSVDKSVREQAEASLHAFQESNWQGYVSGLAQELSNEAKGEQSRQVSGLLLKNLLDAKDARLKVRPSALTTLQLCARLLAEHIRHVSRSLG